MIKKTSIIIVNYNVKDLLKDCLKSIYRNTKNVSFDVWVVDNNSQDGSVSMLKREFPKVNVVANKDNKGFNKANNQAISLSDSDYILLLNPDTLILGNAIQVLCDLLDKNPHIGAVGPMIYKTRDKNKVCYTGGRNMLNFFTLFNTIFALDYLSNDLFKGFIKVSWDHQDSKYVDLLSGSCMLFRRDSRFLPLDETFFMYGDDVDLCYQILKKGYKIFYNTNAKIIHYGSASTKKNFNFNKLKQMRQSQYFFFLKNKGKMYASICLLLLYVYNSPSYLFFREKIKQLLKINI